MNWRELYRVRISSKEIKPEIGMRVKAIKPIESNSATVGVCGTIVNLEGSNVGVVWDKDVNGHSEWTDDESKCCWNGSIKYDWNKGYYQILVK